MMPYMRPLEWLFIIALILYSVSIWADQFAGRLRGWMIISFGLGLSADAAGTVLLCSAAASRWHWNFHTVTGLASLAIMALHFAWALVALSDHRTAAMFHRWSVAAWALWLCSFFSGAFIR